MVERLIYVRSVPVGNAHGVSDPHFAIAVDISEPMHDPLADSGVGGAYSNRHGNYGHEEH